MPNTCSSGLPIRVLTIALGIVEARFPKLHHSVMPPIDLTVMNSAGLPEDTIA